MKLPKMKKINRPFFLFWPVLFLLIPDNCQRVTDKSFKINVLKIQKNEKTKRTDQNAGNAFFGNLTVQNGQKGETFGYEFVDENKRGTAKFQISHHKPQIFLISMQIPGNEYINSLNPVWVNIFC